MTEWIAPAAADERDLRMPCIQQLLRRRCAAAVMRDLENARLRGHETRHDRAFDVAADVAGQQERDVAIENLEHDRIVVAHLRPFPVGRGRMEDEDARGANVEFLSLVALLHRNARYG